MRVLPPCISFLWYLQYFYWEYICNILTYKHTNSLVLYSSAQFTQKFEYGPTVLYTRIWQETIRNLKVTQTGRDAFIVLFVELFPANRTFILSLGASYLERVCLPYNDESCGTQIIWCAVFLQVFFCRASFESQWKKMISFSLA